MDQRMPARPVEERLAELERLADRIEEKARRIVARLVERGEMSRDEAAEILP